MPKPIRRALLIGVTAYDDDSIDPLPFIVEDMDGLQKALTSVGYETQRHPPEQTDRDRIDTAVEHFCRSAEPGQQLMIFLSGHGIHRDGRDYLVPSSADTASRKFAERCLEIDFDGHIENSRCGDVLIVIDACREGIKLREKGGYHGWSGQERRRASGRTIAYLYACSSGEMARWKETQDGTFSLFTRAFSRVIGDNSLSGTLTEIRDEVQRQLEDLGATLGVPMQRTRLKGDDEQFAKFVLVDRPIGAGKPGRVAAWPEIARDHVAWEFTKVGENSGHEPEHASALRDAVVEVATRWSDRYREYREQLRDDPWWDEELAARMHGRLTWIMKHLLNRGKLIEAGRPPISPAEAATLVLTPFAQQLHRASYAALLRQVIDPRDPETGQSKDTTDFYRFVEGQVRIQRRVQRLQVAGDQMHVRTIRWWLFHRWLASLPDAYKPDRVATCLLDGMDVPANAATSLLSEVMSAERVARLLRALRSDPETMAMPEASLDAVSDADMPAGVQTVAGGSPDEQGLRDRLVALLLLAAEEFTIDATALPGVLVDHVGLSGGVDPAEVLQTVRTARWTARGRTRVLEAECSHQAVQLALTEHTAGIAEVLRRIDAIAESDRILEALRDLPTHAAADRLRPLLGHEGHPRYDGVGFRFRLDDDRVQELLMGEQLYGDPALAIRELYQNALDACRYRRARTEYLTRRGHTAPTWDGRIEFEQGVDESGRAWLECRDNGIGMGDRELSSVFSHAGVRFADLPEFLEEQAAWARENVEFHPNSRFGVGVLSYFMLGDEIKVTSTRFMRDGRFGARLQVHIDGPGSLCRIRRVDSGRASGTTVRIYLRSGVSVSCVDLLSRLLWVSEFFVTASDGRLNAQWSPGVLSTRAPIGMENPLKAEVNTYGAYVKPHRPEPPPTFVLPTNVPHIWWCNEIGGTLADGLWAGEAPFGRILNLTGPLAPRLTVDRSRILASDSEQQTRLISAAIPDLLSNRDRILTPYWLQQLSETDLDLADAIAQEAISRGVKWQIAGEAVDTALMGCFPPDEWILRSDRYMRSPDRGMRSPDLYMRSPERTSDVVQLVRFGSWRLRTYIAAGLVPGLRCTSPVRVPPARPSDVILLSRDLNNDGRWVDPVDPVDPAEPVPVTRVIAAAVRLGWSLEAVATRLRELGAVVPEYAWPQATLKADDNLLLLLALGDEARWVDPAEPVPVVRVISAATRLGWSLEAVAARLRELGAVVPEHAWPQVTLTADDKLLLSPGLDSRGRWVNVAERVPVARVIAAAARLGWSPEAVAARLRELGAAVPEHAWPQVTLTANDALLLPWGLDGDVVWVGDGGMWFDLAEPVPVAWVIVAAARLGWSPEAAATRLRELGAAVPEHAWPQVTLTANDKLLLSRDLDGQGPWVDPAEPVPATQVIAAAARLGWSPEAVATRLRELGAAVPEHAWPQVTLTANDKLLLSRDLDGRGRWVDLAEPVPMARVIAVAARLGWSLEAVAARLRELGAVVPAYAWPQATLTADDKVLLGLDGRSRWVDLAEPVPVAWVIAAAVRLRWSPEAVTARLRELGALVPEHAWPQVTMTGDDELLLSERLDGWGSWVDLAEPVPVARVIAAAARLGWSPEAVAARLRELGLMVPEHAWPAIALNQTDWQLLAAEGIQLRGHMSTERSLIWPDISKPIEIGYLLPVVNGTALSRAQAAQRLQQLGFSLPPDIEVAEPYGNDS